MRSLLSGLPLLLLVSTASGQTEEDKAAAEALFDEARKLLKAGKLDEACTKLKASQTLAPAAGTLLNLGDCLERQGKTASAWATFREAASLAKRLSDDRKLKEARRRSEALEAKLARLEIAVPEASRAPELVVAIDGKPVPQPTWGTAIPVDPGPREVTATAEGRKAWATKIEARASRTVRVAVPPLAETPAAGPEPAPTEPVREATPSEPTPTPDPYQEDRPGGGLRTAGLISAAAGVVLIGGGIYFGLQARKKQDEIESLSTDEPMPDVWDASLKMDGERAELAMFVLGGAGVAALATGAILYWLGRSGETATVSLRPGGAVLSVGARF